MKTPYIVHMTDMQRCSLGDLEKFMKEAKEDIQSQGGLIYGWVIHGDSNAFKANKGLTKPFAKAAGIPRPELRWIASVIAGDEGALPFPENRPIDPNSEIYNTLADVLREGNEMTKQRIELIGRMNQRIDSNLGFAPVSLIRGNSEPVYSWWAKYGHAELVVKGELKPVEDVIKEEIAKYIGIQYLDNGIYAWSYGSEVPLSHRISIPWADSELINMIAQYSGVEDSTEPSLEFMKESRIGNHLFECGMYKILESGAKRITINMHGAPTTELSAEAMKYKGKKGKAVEQERLVRAMFQNLRSMQEAIKDTEIRILYGHDGVEAFVDQEAELCGVPFRGIHLVEEGPAHYENLATGEITMSGSAKTMHDKTVAKYEATQTKG